VCNSLNDNDAQRILIYPNPSSGTYHILLDRNFSITITDTKGIIVFTAELSRGLNAIDLSNFAKGIYFTSLSDGTHLQRAKLIRD
jgi:hypothetical protein